jgi:hypothetical protein
LDASALRDGDQRGTPRGSDSWEHCRACVLTTDCDRHDVHHAKREAFVPPRRTDDRSISCPSIVRISRQCLPQQRAALCHCAYLTPCDTL